MPPTSAWSSVPLMLDRSGGGLENPHEAEDTSATQRERCGTRPRGESRPSQRETADAARPLPYDVPGQCFGHRRNNAQREESGFRRGIAGTGASQPVVLRKLKLGGFGLVE